MADFAEMITTVLERGASDLHLSVGSPPIIRVHGALERLNLPVLTCDRAWAGLALPLEIQLLR